ncbi:MAG: hypothetical protein R3F55_18825 [Alphaproteobacteria bacterium]
MSRWRRAATIVWPPRDPALWTLASRDPDVRRRIFRASLLVVPIGYLQLVLCGLIVAGFDEAGRIMVVSLLPGAIGGGVALLAGVFLSAELLSRRRGPIAFALLGTLVYGACLALLGFVAGFFLRLYWPFSPVFGALYALDLFLLLWLGLRHHAAAFWPSGDDAPLPS